MWPIQLTFLLLIICRIFLSSLTLCMYLILLHFSHDLSNWSPSFASTTFQNFPRISELLSEVSKFQHHEDLCSKFSTLLVFSPLNRAQFVGEKSRLLVEQYFCHGNPGFNFTCTSCIICRHATQILEISHILRSFFIYHNMWRICYIYTW